MIKIIQLSKYYGKKQVLNKMDLEFKAGNIYGVVGENGAGKTTLFKCLSGVESYKGLISSDYDNLKNHIGFLHTTPFFFTKITGKEYIQFMVNARNIKLLDIEDKNIFDLPLNQYATTYSSGMKKKLALTALLLQKNEVFILDEPFNGVDVHSNIIIVEIIKKLRGLNKIVIISSHIFSTLESICDVIYHIDKGILIEKVAPKDFKKLEAKMKEKTVGNRINNLGLK